MVPLIINPIYTLFGKGLLWGGLKQLGYHPLWQILLRFQPSQAMRILESMRATMPDVAALQRMEQMRNGGRCEWWWIWSCKEGVSQPLINGGDRWPGDMTMWMFFCWPAIGIISCIVRCTGTQDLVKHGQTVFFCLMGTKAQSHSYCLAHDLTWCCMTVIIVLLSSIMSLASIRCWVWFYVSFEDLTLPKTKHTVGGRNPANQLSLVVYPIIFQGFSTIPGGCLAFLNHQQ